ncbi:MAG: hypothetical protein Q9196_005388 [Gyalolechia fulgens]
MPLEARLLHFSSPRVSATHKWHLSHPDRRGMPIDMATLAAEPVESLAHQKTYRVGILEAVTDVVGEGGLMEGWKVQSIGQGYKDALDTQNAVVMVVREEGKKVVADLGHEVSAKEKKEIDEKKKDGVRTPSASKPSIVPVYTPTFSPVSAISPTHSPYAIVSPASPTYDHSSSEMTVREMI